jgi:tetratricopeptide (TPR) repeat protein
MIAAYATAPGRRATLPLLALLLSMSYAGAAHAADAPPSPQTTFFHANALYKDAQYAAAAQEYEQVVQSGLESGNLYFNLGNAYFKAGEKGKAILNYERARRFMPRDPDVAANLAYAQSLTGADACAPALWQRLAFPLAHRVATGGLVWLTSAAYTLLLVSLTGYRLWPRRPRWLAYTLTGLTLFVVVASSSLADQLLGAVARHQAVVITSGDTPARFEPAASGTVHFALKEGTLVRVLDTRPGWLQIARCDGLRGWVSGEALADLRP